MSADTPGVPGCRAYFKDVCPPCLSERTGDERCDTPNVGLTEPLAVLTEQERTYGRVDPTMQTRGRWYSEASVEKIVAARVAAGRERADAAEAKIAAVVALHADDGNGFCRECARVDADDDQRWPCVTARAALGGEATP